MHSNRYSWSIENAFRYEISSVLGFFVLLLLFKQRQKFLIINECIVFALGWSVWVDALKQKQIEFRENFHKCNNIIEFYYSCVKKKCRKFTRFLTKVHSKAIEFICSRCYARIATYQYQFQYANYDFVTYKIRHLLGGTVAKFQLQNATNSIPW